MTYILSSLKNDQMQHIILLSSIKKQWEMLKEIHNDIGRESLMPLLNPFNQYKAKADQTIDDIVSELRKLAAVIGDIRSDLYSKNTILALVLMNFVDAPQYALTKVFLEHKEDITFLMVIEKLKELEQKTRDTEGTTTTDLKVTNKAFTGQCFFCKKVGHLKKDCVKYLKTDAGKAFLKKQEKEKDKEEDSKSESDSSASTAPVKGKDKKQSARNQEGHRRQKARRIVEKDIESEYDRIIIDIISRKTVK